jgi:hypothetical protein
MRSFLIFLGLLMTVPAFADPLIDYCLTTSDPKTCLVSVLEARDQAQRDFQLQLQAQQLQVQLDAARIQANGMALFGSGPALIQGMNQGFQMMRQPYISTPSQQYK